jgi:ADP-ribosyl-[dinitrogen reductase] hydrolase
VLVELAIGDAYGAGFEYCPPEFVAEHNTLTSYVEHPTHLGLSPGDYTDDTQMTIAIAELLLSDEEWSPVTIAERFVQGFHRDPRVGYSRRFQALLGSSSTGADLLAQITPGSDRSGAAMRAAPIGLLPTIDEVLRHARTQARVTHDSAGGIESAQAAALTVHYCHHHLGPTSEVASWVEQTLRERGGREPWATSWEGPVGAQGAASVRAALSALASARSLRDVLRACVAYTGDVDTVATIALAAGSRTPDLDQDLPGHLYEMLENGTYGHAYLRKLDEQLLVRWAAA